jgi:AcrR family transcriptional regulator
VADNSTAPPLRTRDRIVEHADRLFYEGGYDHTSFATIAAEVGISRGNFHHHFKTKDDILVAVIERRRNSTAAMLSAWESAAATPSDRLRCFIDLVAENRQDIMRYGCPVGSLCSELAKHRHPHLDASGTIFEQFRMWLREQFEQLDVAQAPDDLAMHLLAMSQGVAVLANVYKDPDFVAREVARMHRWLDDTIER